MYGYGLNWFLDWSIVFKIVIHLYNPESIYDMSTLVINSCFVTCEVISITRM